MWETLMTAIGIGAVVLALVLWTIWATFLLAVFAIGSELKIRESLVPLWCILARDEATWDRLEQVLEERRDEPYEPRHALSAEQAREQEVRMQMMLYQHHRWPPYF
jgi:voltage-gated potassium channel Kch